MTTKETRYQILVSTIASPELQAHVVLHGPYTFNELNERIKKREFSITRETQVLIFDENGSDNNWKPARSIDALAAFYHNDEIIINSFEEFIEVTRHLDVFDAVNKSADELNTKRHSFMLGSFCLFRGVPSHTYDLVGRIQFDQQFKRDDDRTIDLVEKQLFDSFKNRAKKQVSIEPKGDWEWLAMARHFGVPTRSLDWTRNPLIALWFALEDDPRKRYDDSIVYAFMPVPREPKTDEKFLYVNTPYFNAKVEYNSLTESGTLEDDKGVILKGPFDNLDKYPEHVGKIILYRPPSITDRIDAVSSWFTIHPYDKKSETYKKLNPNDEHATFFRKIFVRAERKYQIRKDLKQYGIDESFIRQDIDGLGLYLKNRYFKMSDELIDDNSFMPKNIPNTFKEIQSTFYLPNSNKIKEITFINPKELYAKLTDIGAIESFVSYNNVIRDYNFYFEERQVFLKKLEQEMLKSKDKNAFMRLEFLILDSIEDELNISKLDRKSKIRLINHFDCFQDKLSKKHCYFFAGIRDPFLLKVHSEKYLQNNNIKCFLSKSTNEFGFAIINNKFLVLEISTNILDKLLPGSENVMLWIELKGGESNSIIKDYMEYFNERNNKAISYDDIISVVESFKNDADLMKDFVKITLPNMKIDNQDLEEKDYLEVYYPFFVDEEFKELTRFLEFIYYSIPHRYKIKKNTYGENWGIYYENGKELVTKEQLLKKFDPSGSYLQEPFSRDLIDWKGPSSRVLNVMIEASSTFKICKSSFKLD